MLDSLWRVRPAIPRRQVSLFLLAIVVPSAVLVAMAGWMTVQDRELAHKRAIDERQRQADEIRQSLLAYLERLELLHVATHRVMHDGSLATLAEVIDFYDRGGHPNPHLDTELRPLGLSAADKQAVERFLLALSGTVLEGPP